MKLTKRVVDAAQPVQGKKVFLWDDELPGFGVSLSWLGHRPATKSYILQYRTRGRRSRRLTLGRYEVLTCEQARSDARRLLAQVAEGGDPMDERHRLRAESTLGEFAEEYLARVTAKKSKPATLSLYRHLLDRRILPEMGSRKLSAITRHDLVRLHSSMNEIPAMANQVLSLLSVLFRSAESWGLLPTGSDPCRGIPRFPAVKRRRFLSWAELERLGLALAEREHRSPAAILALRLLLLTGMRRGEVMALRWQHVDFERSVLHLPDSKTGAKDVVLGAAALQLLAEAPRESDWVHTSPRDSRTHIRDLSRIWGKIRQEIGIPDVRIHDLRHTFGSVGASAGLGLPIVGALLGHSQPSTTARYAHLADAPLRAGADLISGEIEAALSKRESAEVVELRP